MMFPFFLAAPVCSSEMDLGFVQLGWFKVIFLGIVQGITELVPISSTAHLRIVLKNFLQHNRAVAIFLSS